VADLILTDVSPIGPVLIMGAGSIGCYLGGRLALTGHDVHFVGRPRVLDQLRAHGLTVTEPDGTTATLPADMLSLHEDVPSGLGISLVLLCVKSSATPAAATALARALPIGTLVLCMQNGLHNAEVARSVAARLRFLSGMVPFNVAEIGPGHFLRGSAGALALEDDEVTRAWLPTLAAAGLPASTHKDIRAVQWGKLLLNLNNPVNALSGLPLRDELLQPDLRATTAALIEEALSVLASARQRAGKVAPVPASWLPRLMRMPTPVFKLLARRMLKIDPRARSSMADDLALGRRTEIGELCGEVVKLAKSVGRRAPRNEKMLGLIRYVELTALAVGSTERGPTEPAELRKTIETAM
jgi:2-dehydropantoate 2-reductase